MDEKEVNEEQVYLANFGLQQEPWYIRLVMLILMPRSIKAAQKQAVKEKLNQAKTDEKDKPANYSTIL